MAAAVSARVGDSASVNHVVNLAMVVSDGHAQDGAAFVQALNVKSH